MADFGLACAGLDVADFGLARALLDFLACALADFAALGFEALCLADLCVLALPVFALGLWPSDFEALDLGCCWPSDLVAFDFGGERRRSGGFRLPWALEEPVRLWLRALDPRSFGLIGRVILALFGLRAP